MCFTPTFSFAERSKKLKYSSRQKDKSTLSLGLSSYSAPSALMISPMHLRLTGRKLRCSLQMSIDEAWPFKATPKITT